MTLIFLLLVPALPLLLVGCLYAAVAWTRATSGILILITRHLLHRNDVIRKGDKEGAVVEPCPGGVIVRDILLPEHVLKEKTGSVTVPLVHVQQLQLIWATSSSPLTVRVAGVLVKVVQRRTAPRALAHGAAPQHNYGKLRALEALLWTGQQQSVSTGWRVRQLQLLRFFIGLILRNISVQITGVEVQYVQTGDPLPALTGGDDGCAVDATAITIRALAVSPVVHAPSQQAGKRTSQQAPAADQIRAPKDLAGLPPALQQQLDRWLMSPGVAMKLRAIGSWVSSRVPRAPHVQYCNASRASVTGVDIVLFSRSHLPAKGLARDRRQSPPQLLQSQRAWPRKRRVRMGKPAGSTTPTGVAGPTSGRSGPALEKGALSGAETEWDSQAIILRQWSMQVDISMDREPPDSSLATGKLGHSGGRPLAVNIHGSFGLRSTRSKHSVPEDAAANDAAAGAGPRSDLQVPSVRVAADVYRPGAAEQTAQAAGPSKAQSPESQPPKATVGHLTNSRAALVVDVCVDLKAFLPEVTPEAAVQLLRMVERIGTYGKYYKYWRQRPTVTVQQSPAAWWQHAGRAVIQECRVHGPLRNANKVMARRAEYIRTYTALHSMQRGFQYSISVPDYRVIGNKLPNSAGLHVQLPRIEAVLPRPKKSSLRRHELRAKLEELERELSLSQIMCWRTFVALQRSAYLVRVPAAAERWRAAMSVITTFYDAIPTMEEEEDADYPADGPADDASAANHGGSSQAAAPSAISLVVSCPRVGVKFIYKHDAASVMASSVPSAAGNAATETTDKVRCTADVVSVVLEDIRFVMPSLHHVLIQAATIKGCSFLSSTDNVAKSMLMVPASAECVRAYGTKLDFSSVQATVRPNSGPGGQGGKPWSSSAAIYPDARISSYLSRFKIMLAPVEVALMNPLVVLAGARYIQRMAELNAFSQKADSDTVGRSEHTKSTASLRALVLDSYMRHRVALPSLMASFKPKLQLYCPMVTVRWLISPNFMPAVDGVKSKQAEAVSVAVLTELRLSSRYVSACYSALLQTLSAHAHAEVYFQIQPRSSAPANYGAGCTEAPASLPPQRGDFGKLWLHPEDVALAYPHHVLLPTRPRRRQTAPSVISEAASASTANSSNGQPPSFPFLPLVKIRGLAALALSQVPYEPAVPGTMTAHQTVGVHSILAWFSPWQAKFVTAAIDQFLHHPVLALLRGLRAGKEGSSHVAGPAAANTATNAPASGARPAGVGSNVSVLMDIPLLALNCYVERPTGSGLHQDPLHTPATEIQAAAWVKKAAADRLQRPAADVEREDKQQSGTFSGVDPVLRWGLRLAPLMALNLTNIRSGIRLTKDSSLHAAVQLRGLQLTDHQARLKRQLYKDVWLANAGRPSDNPVAEGPRHSSFLPAESSSDQVLGPLPTRAEAVRSFACYRRRAALCLGLHLVPDQADKRGQARHVWSRLLELQQLQRASDFAMFLMSKACQKAVHLTRYASMEPIDCYRILFEASLHAEKEDGCTRREHMPEPHTQGGSVAAGGLPISSGLPPTSPSECSTADVRSQLTRPSMEGGNKGALGGVVRMKRPSMVLAISSVGHGEAYGMKEINRKARAELLSQEAVGSITAGGMGLESGSLASGFQRISESRFASAAGIAARSISTSRPSQGSLGDPGSTAVDDLLRHISVAYQHTSSSGIGPPFPAYLAADPDTACLRLDSEVLPHFHDARRSLAAGAQRAAPSRAVPVTPPHTEQTRTGGQVPLSHKEIVMASAAERLSFVQAFGSFDMPFLDANFSEVPGSVEPHPVKYVSVNCQPLQGCVGVHSVGAVLHLLLQVQQALRGGSASKLQAQRRDQGAPAAHGGTPGKSRSQPHVALVLSYVSLKVVLEERPRRQTVAAAAPGLTELTAVRLQCVTVTAHAPLEPAKITISGVEVLDLQGCVEHRNVLVANRASPEASNATGFTPQPSVPATQRPPPTSCEVEVILETAARPDLPFLVKIAVRYPCLTWLRRYSNNVAYAVGVINKAYLDAVAAQRLDNIPVSVPAETQGEGPPSSVPSPATHVPPLITVRVEQLAMVMPAGAAAKKGTIRRSISNAALFFRAADVSLCVPGDMTSLQRIKLWESDNTCFPSPFEQHWVPSESFVRDLIMDGAGLNDKHFPGQNQTTSVQNPSAQTPSSDPDSHASMPQPSPDLTERAMLQPTGRIQRGLQAAKAALIDPLREIAEEVGKDTRHGEQGLLLIDEGPARGAIREVQAGYLSIPEDDHRTLTSVAAMQHTTSTFPALMPQQHGTRPGQQPIAGLTPQAAGSAGGVAAGADNLQATPAAPHGVTAPAFTPIIVFTASGLSAYSCKLVPCDKLEAGTYAPRRLGPDEPGTGGPQAGASQRADGPLLRSQATLAHGLPAGVQDLLAPDLDARERIPGVHDPAVEHALQVLSNPARKGVQQLIEPVKMDGILFHHTKHSALHLHLSAPDGMAATLGPSRYDRMIKVLTDNVVEAHSCFNVGFASNASKPERKTTFSPDVVFGPRSGEVPYFHLTISWPDRLLAGLESDPAWWRSDREPGVYVDACLQACFTQCSLALMLMREKGDMHLDFRSQQVHVADVRPNNLVQEATDRTGRPISGMDAGSELCPSEYHSGVVEDPNASGESEGYNEDEDEALGETDGGSTGDRSGSTEAPLGADVQPVVDYQQSELFPGMAAVVTLLRSTISLPTDEAAHLASGWGTGNSSSSPSEGGQCPRDDHHDCLRLSFTMMHDGTMANEVELCHTLVQWPYLTEMSLVSAIIAIFIPNWCRPAQGLEASLRLTMSAWFYFNLVLKDSQLFVPVLAPHLRASCADGVQLTSENLQELFALMVAADTVGQRAARKAVRSHQRLSSSRPSPSLNEDSAGETPRLGVPAGLGWRSQRLKAAEGEPSQRLEHAGIVLTMSALRVGYFAGGDGQSMIKVDLRNTAGCMRHSSAHVTNWLLPVRTMSFEYECSMPIVDESQMLEEYILAARTMWMLRLMSRTKKADDGPGADKPQQLSRQTSARQSKQQQPELATSQQNPPRLQFAETTAMISTSRNAPGYGIAEQDILSIHSRVTRGDAERPALDLLIEQAMARASDLLEKHKLSLPTSAMARATMDKLLARRAATTSLRLYSDSIVVRASFSNIPLWHDLTDDISLAAGLLQRNRGIFAPAPGLRMARSAPAAQVPAQAEAEQSKAMWNFRQSTMSVDVELKSLAFVLCDDKPKSYGAPDVLTAATEHLTLQYCRDKRYVDHLPEQSGSLSVRLSAQFLNNSTGRWEYLLEPWPAEIHLFDPINPIFKSSRTKYIFMSSSDLFKLSFHPSCLLSIGDAMAFSRHLTNRDSAGANGARRNLHLAAPKHDKPPTIREQMALGGSVLSRVPQRYLIQNLTGMMFSYWAPQPEHDARAQGEPKEKWLPSGVSEELRVVPMLKQVKVVGPGSVVITRIHSMVIDLKFEGNWLPISDVSVDVVGKYCYDLRSPTEDLCAPVVVDVVLVGRTKILKIHSALYLRNASTLRMGVRLHFPSAMLARQVALLPGDDRLPGEQDIRLRSLRPAEGRYLPVLAALGGTLYLEPRLASRPGCLYMPPEHDVIRLFPAVNDMLSQSGFIACGPLVGTAKGLYGSSPLHFAVKVKVKSQSEFTYAAFHSIEVPGPGLFAKATRPLEAAIKVTPTLTVTNALPYSMDGYLITVNRNLRESQAGTDGSGRVSVKPKAPVVVPTAESKVTEDCLEAAPVNPPAPSVADAAARGPPAEATRATSPKPAEASIVAADAEPARVVAAFTNLAQVMRHKMPQLHGLETVDQKLHLLLLLRYELRCIFKESIKELELLKKCETREQAEKVSWQELGGFIEWTKNNVRRVQVRPGAVQRHYVDMHKQVLLCVRVPDLKLVSTGPVEVNSGEPANSQQIEQLPEVIVLRSIADSESIEKMSHNLFGPKTAESKFTVPNIMDIVRTGAHGIHTAATATATALGNIPLRTVTHGSHDSPLSEFWRQHPDTWIRVQLIVRQGPPCTVVNTEGSLSSPGASPAQGDVMTPGGAPTTHFSSEKRTGARSPRQSLAGLFSASVLVGRRAILSAEQGMKRMVTHGDEQTREPMERDAAPLRRAEGHFMAGAGMVPSAEEHVRLQLSYRPPPESPIVGQVLHNVTKRFSRMWKGADEGASSIPRKRIAPVRTASTVHPPQTTHHFVRVRLEIVPATAESPEHVRLRLQVLVVENFVRRRMHCGTLGSLRLMRGVQEPRRASMQFELSRVPGFVQRDGMHTVIPEKEEKADESATYDSATYNRAGMPVPGVPPQGPSVYTPVPGGYHTMASFAVSDGFPRTPDDPQSRSDGSQQRLGAPPSRADLSPSWHSPVASGTRSNTDTGSNAPDGRVTRVLSDERSTPTPSSTPETKGRVAPGPSPEATPGTVVVGSGPVRPISVPSISTASHPRESGAKDSPGSGVATLPTTSTSTSPAYLGQTTTVTEQTQTGSNSAGPALEQERRVAISNTTLARRALWSDNAAYLHGSGSTVSASELPVRGQPSDFGVRHPALARHSKQTQSTGSGCNWQAVEGSRPSVYQQQASLGVVLTRRATSSAGRNLLRVRRSSGRTMSQQLGRTCSETRGMKSLASAPDGDLARVERGVSLIQQVRTGSLVRRFGYFARPSDQGDATVRKSVSELPAQSPVVRGVTLGRLTGLSGPGGRRPSSMKQRQSIDPQSLDALPQLFHSLQVSEERPRRLHRKLLPGSRRVSKKAAQPTYKRLLLSDDGPRISPFSAAVQAVQNVPAIALNVAGKIVDGGQQVAVDLASTVMAGGQGVKAGTEQVINCAKPKIKKGFGELVWQMTECMRIRKAGDDRSRLADGTRKKLNLHNSLAAKEDDYVCRLTLSAPFWVDNRTGFDLVFKEQDVYRYADGLPCLPFNPVRARGHAGDAQAPDIAPEGAGGRMEARASPLGNRRQADGSIISSRLQEVLRTPADAPVLLNDQRQARFRVDDENFSKTRFSLAFTVENTTQKFAVDVQSEKVNLTAEAFEILMSRGVALHHQRTCTASLPVTCTYSDRPGLVSGKAEHAEADPSQHVGPGLPLPTLPSIGSQFLASQSSSPSGSHRLLSAGAAQDLPGVEGQTSLSTVVPEITPADDGNEAEEGLPARSRRLSTIDDMSPQHSADQGSLMGASSSQPCEGTTPTVALELSAAERNGSKLLPSSQAAEPEAGAPTRSTLVTQYGARLDWSNRLKFDGFPGHKPKPKLVPVRRLYQFAVEVWPAPNETVFKRTKVITVKNKYLVLNATGVPIEFKQKGTPDPNVDGGTFGKGKRFSGTLENGWRTAWHWDNAYAEQELMIRPAGEDWEWSGSFKLPEVEDYFGLRIRRRNHHEYVIIPVNITVGAAGSVLVTLKSKGSVPPYMIINRCQEVVIRLKQSEWAGRNPAGDWADWDEIQPNGNSSMPFAWDEPRLKHYVKVIARPQGEQFPDDPVTSTGTEVNLDAVDASKVMEVQSRTVQPQRSKSMAHDRTKFLPDNAKKVYITVYADGPTRVLCFSEDRTGMASMDDENSLLNLSYRIQQVAFRLKDVERRLTHEFGTAPERPRTHQEPRGIHPVMAAEVVGVSPDVDSQMPESSSRYTSIIGPGPSILVPSSAIRSNLGGFGTATAQRTYTPRSGTATPPSAHQGAPPAPVPMSSFAFPRHVSVGNRLGSLAMLDPRMVSFNGLPPMVGAGAARSVQPHHSRHPSDPREAFLPTMQTSVALGGPRPLAPLAMSADGTLTPLMEVLPACPSDVYVPIGGDLTVLLRYVEGLTAGFKSNEMLMAVEAKMVVKSADPLLKEQRGTITVTTRCTQGADANMASARGSAVGAVGSSGGAGANPGRFSLQRHITFRDIPASSELQIDFFVAKTAEMDRPPSSSRPEQLQRMPTGANAEILADASPSDATALWGQHGASRTPEAGQFAGCVRVPLLLTFGRDRSQEWRLPLERKTGSQVVRGHVVVSFEWSVTNEGVLIREVTALERILAEKIELLAMLSPLPASESSRFVKALGGDALTSNATTTTVSSPVVAPDLPVDARPLLLGASGAASGPPRNAPAQRTAKAMAESYFINLELSVLEVSGLLPREGLRATLAASMYGRQPANMVSTAMLPNAVVSMTCSGETHVAAAGVRSVNPRFPKNACTFKNVPLGGKVRLQVLDNVSNSYNKTLAEAEICLADIKGTDPIYAWLALPRQKKSSTSQRMLALLMVMEEDGDANLQVLMRIKIHKPQVHGVLAAVNLNLAGVGLCARTNMEELFNFTMQKVRASLVQTRTELQTAFAVQGIQLDNQMLEASNPVVLSPADGSQSGSVGHARRRHIERLEKRARETNTVLRLGSPDSVLRDPLLSIEITYNKASSNQASNNQTSSNQPALGEGKQQDNAAGILAFKKVIVDLGPLDFSADQEFIEGVIAYIKNMPLADLRQDEAWQQQIDAMQGGAGAPVGGREVLTGHTPARRDQPLTEPYQWLADKETAELELLRGQSSMWFYLEEFYLSDIFISVTLALSSNFNTGGGGHRAPSAASGEDERQRSMLRGFLSRVSGSNGFQLINVTNVPIQLDAMELQNHLVNRVSLINKLHRHYQWIAVAQARKVLGGAGPAIAQIPASLLWASIALVDVAQDVAAKRVNPILVPTRIGYVMFTLTGQVMGALSRTMCAVMAVLPPRFSVDTHYLTDTEAARRFGVKPLTVMDAVFMAQRDVMLGLTSGAFGFVHDTAAGGRYKGALIALGIPMGLAKAVLGVGVRPAAGAVEATSKVLQGIGLLCLGKRGIQGKLVRRVQAPGVAVTDVVQAARVSAALEALQADMIAAWQAALPSISSDLAEDRVIDVVAARPTRVVLLTDHHLAYIYAKRHAAPSSSSAAGDSGSARKLGSLSVTYKVKWVIPTEHIDNIRGLERNFCVSVDYHKPVRLGRLSLKLPLHRGMRTTSAEGHKDLIFRLNRHLGHSTSSTTAHRYNSLLAADSSGTPAIPGADNLRITSYGSRDGVSA